VPAIRQARVLLAAIALHSAFAGGYLANYISGNAEAVICLPVVPAYVLFAFVLMLMGLRSNRSGPRWIGVVHILLVSGSLVFVVFF
jgi:hypothetical protein